MTNITAKMAHSKESVELMCITQYNTFEFGKKIALPVLQKGAFKVEIRLTGLFTENQFAVPAFYQAARVYAEG